MALLTSYYPQFVTATILNWKLLLKQDKYKDIIVSSFQRQGSIDCFDYSFYYAGKSITALKNIALI